MKLDEVRTCRLECHNSVIINEYEIWSKKYVKCMLSD